MAASWTGSGGFGLGFCDGVGALAVKELGYCYLDGGGFRSVGGLWDTRRMGKCGGLT